MAAEAAEAAEAVRAPVLVVPEAVEGRPAWGVAAVEVEAITTPAQLVGMLAVTVASTLPI
jgi:hypothetical protein